MATEVRHRRGTTAEHATFTGAQGEVTVDTTRNVLVVHDGVTPGGFAAEPSSVLKARANHTGTQTAATISDFAVAARAVTEAQLLPGTNVTLTPTGNNITVGVTIPTLPVPAFNECRLVRQDANTIRLDRCNGSYITLSGTPRQIPQAGITFTPVHTGMGYVFAKWNGSNIVLSIETVAGVVNATTGQWVSSTDATAVLVGGCAREGGVVRDELAYRGVHSLFNTPGTRAAGGTLASAIFPLASTTTTVVTATLALCVPTVISAAINGVATNSGGAEATYRTRLAFNGTPERGTMAQIASTKAATFSIGLHTGLPAGLWKADAQFICESSPATVYEGLDGFRMSIVTA